MTLLVAGMTFLAIGTAWAQRGLPPCSGPFAANKWSNCFGTNMTNTGDTYSGEWLNDKFEGYGTYRYRNGAKFVDEYLNDKRNGPGTEYGPDGKVLQAGTWKDDVLVKRQ